MLCGSPRSPTLGGPITRTGRGEVDPIGLHGPAIRLLWPTLDQDAINTKTSDTKVSGQCRSMTPNHTMLLQCCCSEITEDASAQPKQLNKGTPRAKDSVAAKMDLLQILDTRKVRAVKSFCSVIQADTSRQRLGTIREQNLLTPRQKGGSTKSATPHSKPGTRARNATKRQYYRLPAC